MNHCGALVPRDSIGQDGMDLFVKCNLSFQKIGFILEKWQESVRNIRPSLLRREVAGAEACLRETEQRIWQLFMRQMNPVGINAGNGPSVEVATDMRHRSPVPRNQYGDMNQPGTISEHVVQVQKHISVAMTKCDAAPELQQQRPQQAITSVQAAQETPLENLLMDWFLSLDENEKLRLEGTLLNEGRWKTTPIAVRVGRTTVKTNSGTIYNISGKMSVTNDEDIPIFVQEKFEHGFPPDWDEVVQQWRELIALQKRKAIQENVVMLAKSPPCSEQLPLKPVSSNTQTRPHDKEMPPPSVTRQKKENCIQDQAMARPTQAIPVEVERRLKHCGVGSDSPKQRFSKRVLNRTLEELSLNGTLNKTQDVSADIMLIKKWFVEVDGDSGNLILLGHLVTDKGKLIERYFVSEWITRRLKCDLIETIDGDIYRLLGPSVATQPKALEHGFPHNWKELLKKGHFPVRVVEQKQISSRKRDASNAGGANETKLNYSTRSSMAGTSDPNKKSLMIQQVIRQRINQGQTSMSDSRTNRMKDKNASLYNKRMLEMCGFSSNDVVPLKRKRSDESIKASEGTNKRAADRHHSTVQDVSVTSDDFKAALVEGWTKERPVLDTNGDVTVSNGPGKQKKNTTFKAASQKGKPQPSTSNKYLSGMLSENGSAEFDFNIF